jgi:hypothetical protein
MGRPCDRRFVADIRPGRFVTFQEEPMQMRWLTAVLLAGTAGLATLVAQTIPPIASPRGSAAAQVSGTWEQTERGPRYTGGKWITVDYGRPILRGRENIFGSGADYGKQVLGNASIWRAGANETTRLTTEAPLVFGGKTVEPGTYSVFVDLKEGAWTFVLSTQPVQEQYDPQDKTRTFGAYNYDPKFEVVRVPMKLMESPVSAEQFTIAFVDMTPQGGSLAMWWNKTMATVGFTVGAGTS